MKEVDWTGVGCVAQGLLLRGKDKYSVGVIAHKNELKETELNR